MGAQTTSGEGSQEVGGSEMSCRKLHNTGWLSNMRLTVRSLQHKEEEGAWFRRRKGHGLGGGRGGVKEEEDSEVLLH